MRKTWIVLLLMALSVTVAACGGDSGNESGNDTPDNASEDTESAPEGDPDAFCAAAQDFARSIGSGGAPDFDAMTAALADMETSAPEEISADVTTVKNALEAGLESDEGNPLSEAAVQEANDRIFDYLSESDCEPPEDA